MSQVPSKLANVGIANTSGLLQNQWGTASRALGLYGMSVSFVGGGAGGQARLRYGFSGRAEIGVSSFAMLAGSADPVKKRYPSGLPSIPRHRARLSRSRFL